MQIGRKTKNITIPEFIFADDEKLKGYLRGVFDGEGSLVSAKFLKKGKLYKYPRVIIKISSRSWIVDLHNALKLLETKHTKFEYPHNNRFEIHVNGIKNVSDFYRKIGTSHPEKLNKFILWSAHC